MQEIKQDEIDEVGGGLSYPTPLPSDDTPGMPTPWPGPKFPNPCPDPLQF
jgi:hypothetical protein